MKKYNFMRAEMPPIEEFSRVSSNPKDIKNKIREICTYHGEDGTSGYLLDEQRFAKIFELIDKLTNK